MNNLSSSSVEDRCPFIDFYCSHCECVWPSTYGALGQLLGGSVYRVLTVTLICMRLLTKERKLDMPWPDTC